MDTPRKVERPALKKRTPAPPAPVDTTPHEARLVPVMGVQDRDTLLLSEGVNVTGDRRLRLEVQRHLEDDPILSITCTDEGSGRTVAHLSIPLSKIKHHLIALLQ